MKAKCGTLLVPAKTVWRGIALASVMAFSSSAFAITVETSNFISSPTDFDGFETFTSAFVGPGPYTEGGITVQYVGNTTSALKGNPDGIWTTFTSSIGGQGNYGWYANGGGYGYTDITLADGADFQDAQFLVGTGSPNAIPIEYELLEHGVVVASGNSPGTNLHGPMTYLGFSGGGFDEIWVQALFNGGPDFDPLADIPAGYELVALDSIAATEGVPTTPLPAALPLFATGFAGLGLLGWRRKRKNAAIAA
jgi:hypothetical protein